MNEEYLASMTIGDIINYIGGKSITKVGDDLFSVTDLFGGVTVGDASTAIKAMNNNHNNPLLSAVWPHRSMPSLSREEEVELERLEKELDNYKKNKKIEKFKSMPTHIRQEIVDDAYTNDLVQALHNESGKDFDQQNRLDELRNKRMGLQWGTVHSTSLHMPSFNYSEGYGSKYSTILAHFTTDELARAHAEACLEEGLQT